jgi:hypothetical protein
MFIPVAMRANGTQESPLVIDTGWIGVPPVAPTGAPRNTAGIAVTVIGAAAARRWAVLLLDRRSLAASAAVERTAPAIMAPTKVSVRPARIP